jgi:DNA-binding response OmpR family regulator
VPRILLVEREGGRNPSFAPSLRRRHIDVVIEFGFRSAIENIENHHPDLIVLDAASMRTSGKRMAGRLIEACDGIPLIRITTAEPGSQQRRANEFILTHPFVPRKLVNLASRLLPSGPEHEIHLGHISSDTKSRVLRCHGRCTLLTPKTMALFLFLQKNRGRLVTRARLMKHVWGTDYTGDMRTIDVHVSWLRNAIELDPEAPQFLKTIRGVGYRLDIE